MSTEGLINISQAVSHGNFRQVTNRKTGKCGIVIKVSGNNLVVKVEQDSCIWPYEDCE